MAGPGEAQTRRPRGEEPSNPLRFHMIYSALDSVAQRGQHAGVRFGYGRGLSALFYGSLIIGVCLRLFLAFYLPLDDNEPKHGVYGFNDEPSHLAYVRYL